MQAPAIGTAWVDAAVIALLLHEAQRALPQESGGVLVGYWVKEWEEVVITTATGPGPAATHQNDRFLPDTAYHEREVARIYAESGRLHSYLGDWHSHPGGQPIASSTDHRTLRKIAESPEARAPRPLMAIAGRTTVGDGDWVIKIWQYTPPTRWNSLATAHLVDLQIRQYET